MPPAEKSFKWLPQQKLIKRRSPDASRFVLVAHTGNKRVLPGFIRIMEYFDVAWTGSDHCNLRERDPKIFILHKPGVAICPVIQLIFPPFGMNVPADFRRQAIGYALHRKPCESLYCDHIFFIRKLGNVRACVPGCRSSQGVTFSDQRAPCSRSPSPLK